MTEWLGTHDEIKTWITSERSLPGKESPGLYCKRQWWFWFLYCVNIYYESIENNFIRMYIYNGILHTARTNNFTFCMEIQKTLNSQGNLEKEEWNWRNQPAWLQALLQSHSHQDSLLLAQRQKYRSMEHTTKPRDKYTHLWTPYVWQRRQEYTVKKRQSL